jgi:signal transduction histidine kinase/DNA-binding response OmpR family regulator
MSWLLRLGRIGVLPTDGDRERREKIVLTSVSLFYCFIGSMWGLLFYLLDQPLAAVFPWGYAVIVGLAAVRFAFDKRYVRFRTITFLLMLLLPYGVQWSVGGYAASGTVMLWALMAPLLALMFTGVRHSLPWFIAYAVIAVVSGLLDGFLAAHASPMPPAVVSAFAVGNVVGVSLAAYFMMQVYVSEDRRAMQALNAELEKALARTERQNEELKELDRLKDQFLANTSHELRTPINGILGLIGAILDGADGALNSKQEAHLVMVKESGERLKTLVTNILDFSKLRAGQQKFDLRPFRLADLTKPLSALGEGLLRGKPVALEVDLPKAPAVLADHERVHQVLVNLVGNAAKFTTEGKIRVFTVPSEGFLKISVEDTGSGIPDEAKKYLFQEFRQVDGSTSRTTEGTGLGLAISKELVTAMGGSIGFDSELGKGTTFFFTLRAAEGVALSSLAPAPPPSAVLEKTAPTSILPQPARPLVRAQDGQGERVLVVDDVPVNVEALITQLEHRGYVPLKAYSAQEALKIAKSEKPDAIVSDVMMPGMTGYDLCLALKEDPELRSVPIILLTAKSGTVQDKLVGFNAGASDYVVKPFEPEELLARLHRLFHKRPSEAPSEKPAEPYFETPTTYAGVDIRGGGELVLCVDDNPINREVLKIQLERVNYRVLLAADGVEALEQLDKNPVELILLDVMMPRMSGYEFLERMNERGRAKETPVVVVSAKDRTEDSLVAYGLGVVDYVTKPFVPSVVSAKVGAILALRRTQSTLGTIAAELGVARLVQQASFPKWELDIDGYGLRGLIQSAESSGGDWYGYFTSPSKDRLTLIAGDVTGHGVSAALVALAASSIKTTIEIIETMIDTSKHGETVLAALRGKVPGEVLDGFERLIKTPHSPKLLAALLNDVFHRSRSFLQMAASVVSLDLVNGDLRYVNAGAPWPFHLKRSGQEWIADALEVKAGKTLGAEANANLEEQHFTLEPGEALFLYTDGLTEAEGPGGAQYGFRRLRRLLKEIADKNQPLAPELIRDKVASDLFAFTSDLPLEDDVTIVALQRRAVP